MHAQVTLTVNQGKKLIAEAVAHRLHELQRALESGKLLLKGGTTVSAVAEALVGTSLRICGRVTVHGTKVARHRTDTSHCILIENGEYRNVDTCLDLVEREMHRGDVAVIGANALDVDGRAGLMIGVPSGGGVLRLLEEFRRNGVTIIVAVGLEKLIPHSIDHAAEVAGCRGVGLATGMAVGLMPVKGKVLTEEEALECLGEVEATVIGSGGLLAAEGVTTLVVEGAATEVEKVLARIRDTKGASLSGHPERLPEREPAHRNCFRHRGCVYGRSEWPALRPGQKVSRLGRGDRSHCYVVCPIGAS